MHRGATLIPININSAYQVYIHLSNDVQWYRDASLLAIDLIVPSNHASFEGKGNRLHIGLSLPRYIKTVYVCNNVCLTCVAVYTYYMVTADYMDRSDKRAVVRKISDVAVSNIRRVRELVSSIHTYIYSICCIHT